MLVGGARSGKSALALRIAADAGAPVTFIATAEALDEEMALRVAEHRAGRPTCWATVEEPLELGAALGAVPAGGTAVVDCLTMWVANMVGVGETDGAVLLAAEQVAALASERIGLVVTVSNEVGWGIVPADPATRRYRDLLGRVNATFAAAAERPLLVVAGCVLPLQRPGGTAAAVPGADPR